MTRKETIEKYASAFLKGKSASAIEKFNAKDDNLKYASIMQWRRRMKKIENTPKSTKEITDALSHVISLIENAPEIPDNDFQLIYSEIDEIRNALAKYYENQKARRINELEAKSREIAQQLESLRGC